MSRARNSRLAAAALVCAATVLAGTAIALAQAPEPITLGEAKKANASCPDDCLVEARVTGFQTAIGKQSVSPFVAPSDGRITAWSIKLGKPGKRDRRLFNDAFGAPKARIGVLRLVEGSASPPKYKLLRQSPIEPLGDLFGQTTTFALDTHLPIKSGEIVALTIKTWAPAFAVGQGARSTWTASRNATKKRGRCTDSEGRANVKAGAPQVKKGSTRPYGCNYNKARLLYSARFQPDEDGGGL